jgi:hypothetical protein
LQGRLAWPIWNLTKDNYKKEPVMKQTYAILGIIIFLGGMALGAALTWRSSKTLYTAGTETLSVTVTKHDTICAYKTVHDVRTSMLIDTVRTPVTELVEVPGVTGMMDSMHIDTSHCYTIDKKEADGTYIAATLCSRYFTALPPPDLRGTITYAAAPDTQRTILRVDTLSRTKTNWTITAVAACAGVIAGVLARR